MINKIKMTISENKDDIVEISALIVKDGFR